MKKKMSESVNIDHVFKRGKYIVAVIFDGGETRLLKFEYEKFKNSSISHRSVVTSIHNYSHCVGRLDFIDPKGLLVAAYYGFFGQKQ